MAIFNGGNNGMSITSGQLRHLRGLAHHLRPVVTLGQAGLTDAVMREIETALQFHELIKVKLAGADRAERTLLVQRILERSNAELIQQIGATASIFRRNPDKPRVRLPE
jgi:RNA-binding protein